MRLAAAVPADRLHPAVGEWIRHSPLRQRWAVAFSGGADSLLLLLLLWAHWPERRRGLCALHFDHRLRGRDSANDARFCRAVCRALRIDYVGGRWARPPRQPSEAAARTARHDFFRAHLQRRRTPVLWLGHQQDDIAETMLMRLARGSGSGGLAAPRPVQRWADGRVHLRPLLTLPKSAIIAALRQVRAPWREDASNATGIFLRNRMRRQALAAWRAAVTDRDPLAGAALARELLEEDDVALEAWAAQLAPTRPGGALRLTRLRQAPRAVARRAIQRWLAQLQPPVSISRQAVGAIIDDVIAGRRSRHSVGTDRLAVLTRGRLMIR